MSERRVTWKDKDFADNERDNQNSQELMEVTEFDSDNCPVNSNMATYKTEDMDVNRRDSIGLLASFVRQESLTQETPDLEERMAEVNDLIFRLEDMAAMLKTQLHSARESLQRRKPVASKRKLPFAIKYQLLIVVALQAFSLTVFQIYDHFWKGGSKSLEVMTDVIGVSVFVINALVVGVATVILSKTLMKHDVESTFMAQTYLSTVIVFSGLYFLIFSFEPESWEFSETDNIRSSSPFSQYVRMLYLSVSSATLCGAANIQPKEWYVTLMVCFQSLVNFVYFASILAQTIGNYSSYTVQVQRSESLTQSLGQRRGTAASELPISRA